MVGTIVSTGETDGIRVQLLSAAEPVEAESTVRITPDDAGRRALLVFPSGSAEHPVIVGLLQPEAGGGAGAAGDEAARRKTEHRESGRLASEAEGGTVTLALPEDALCEIHLDGEALHLTARREIRLTCGKSSLQLRADGRVVIKGETVLSRARGANKVRGGAVLIN